MQTSTVALMHGMSKPSNTPDFSAIPQEMRERGQWVLFRIEGEGKKKTKVPYQPERQARQHQEPEDLEFVRAGRGRLQRRRV
jgi:hypothetical protein